ncbi:hypothetical protein TeGR_g8266 [Tetraparma gracilis]|uniref:WW domain-containing protein n=1 Tax=Tetraparma gracilis TaxID=2962635 RepID=A0ABQ6N5J8_9STRA|nr:hypothetical protein TeGR_g8266 [Tetraparma gracilis]
MGAHPNSSDVRAFAVACQIDPSFDTKYIPMITAACEGELPPTWVSVIDPSDKWYFCTHFKPVVKKYLEDNPHSPPAVALAASGGKRPKSLSVWEHPSVPALRDEVQELIAEDEKQERLAMEALNPIDPEEARLKKIKMGKRQIIKSVEVVVLDAKAMYGSPDVDDVVCDSSHDGFFTCDPEDFLFACDALKIPLPPETGYHDSLLWPARMCALTPLPDNWTRGPDLPRAEDGTVKRQYRCDEWENEEMYIHEPPVFKYWRNVVVAKRVELGEKREEEGEDGVEDDVGLQERLNVVVENEYEINLFVGKKSGRRCFLDFETRDITWEDGLGWDPEVEEEGAEEEQVVVVEKVESEEEEGGEGGVEVEEGAIKKFAKQCKITPYEYKHNPKVRVYLEEQLLLSLPDGWVKHVNPDGEVHYVHEYKKISMWDHPRASLVQQIHERVVARRKKVELDARLKERQEKAMAAALDKTKAHVSHANLASSNREKTEKEKIYFSGLAPLDEAVEFYERRYGEAERFLVAGPDFVLREMNAEGGDVDVSPAQVIQMALFFGIDVAREPWLLCIAMCAVLAPIPPFWYVLMPEAEEAPEADGGRGVKSRAESRGQQVHVRTIDFEIGEGGGGYFLPKEEELAPLLFARDVSDASTHRQEAHPSDPYWRKVVEVSREGAVRLTANERLRCCVLPFFNQIARGLRSAEGSGDLFYYDFVAGKPLFADEKGEFVAPKEMEEALPKIVSGKRGMRIGGINKADKGLARQMMKVSVSTPSFLPPIPNPHSKEQENELNGDMKSILDATRFLLGVEEEEAERAEMGGSRMRPRTRQALTPAVEEGAEGEVRGAGALHVGFSGMERTLHLHGRSTTPWVNKDEEGRVIEEQEFEGLFTNFLYLGGGGGGDEYVWSDDV